MDFSKMLKLILGLCVFGMLEAKKNVLFLVADDMRPQIGAWEGPYFPSPVHPKMHTPNLDALAKRSLLLKRAYTQQAICSPSRTSLLTGRRPDTTHVYDLFHYFRDVGGNFTTLPEYFKLNGYTSVGMGKIFHPGRASGNDDPVSWSLPYFHGVRNFESREKSLIAVPDEELKDKPLIDEQVANHAIETLKMLAPAAKSGDKPFFVAVGFHKPHLPFVFPESMLDYYPEADIHLPDNPYAPVNMPPVAWSNNMELRMYQDISQLNVSGDINTTLPDSTVLELRRGYYSAVSWTDFLVGRVIKELDNLELFDNTIISFWGDHGWQLGEHGEWGKVTDFEVATHAPMMIHIPQLTDNGIATEQLTEFVDLFPTLVEAAGLPSMDVCPENSTNVRLCREGTSLMSLIANPESPVKRAAFSQYPRNNGEIMGYTMKTDKYRYTEWAEFIGEPVYGPNWDSLEGKELYDHVNDPEENNNRAYDSDFENIAMELSKMLHEGWRNAQIA